MVDDVPNDQDLDDEGLADSEWENRDEERMALKLINEYGKSACHFNTDSWVNDYRKRVGMHDKSPITATQLLELSDRMVAFEDEPFFAETEPNTIGLEEIEALDEQWQLIKSSDCTFATDEQNRRGGNPLERFITCINSGEYPPPELLVMVTKSFNLYLQARGKLDLETVFFDKPRKRAGNYAARKASAASYEEFHAAYTSACKTGSRVSLPAFIREYINAHRDDATPPIPVYDETGESFLRGYRRWKKLNLLNGEG